MKLKNKKGMGIVGGMILLILVLFIFAIVNMTSYNVYKDIMPDINNSLTSTEAVASLDESYSRMPEALDSLILFVLVGIWVVGLISAYIGDEHPLLFGFMIFAVMFTIVAGMMLGNSYEDMVSDSDLSDMPSIFIIHNFVLTRMMSIGIGVAIVMLIIRFAKNRL